MKNIYFTLWGLLAVAGLSAQGTQFFEGTWEEALTKAQTEDKILFVDAHTSWCGPCKRMKKEVFPLEEVATFLEKDFITLALDLETPRGLLFSLYYNVRAYPTFLFIDADGTEIYNTIGYKNPDQLFKMCNDVLDIYNHPDKIKAYWENRPNDQLLDKYMLSTRLAGVPNEQFLLDYLSSSEKSESEQVVYMHKYIHSLGGQLIKEIQVGNRLSELEKSIGKEDAAAGIWKVFMREMQEAAGDKKALKQIQKQLKAVPYITKTEFTKYKAFQDAYLNQDKEAYMKAVKTLYKLLPTLALKKEFIIHLFDKKINGKSMNQLAIDLANERYEHSQAIPDYVLYLKLLIIDEQYQTAKPHMEALTEILVKNNDNRTQIELRRYNKMLRRKLAGM